MAILSGFLTVFSMVLAVFRGSYFSLPWSLSCDDYFFSCSHAHRIVWTLAELMANFDIRRLTPTELMNPHLAQNSYFEWFSDWFSMVFRFISRLGREDEAGGGWGSTRSSISVKNSPLEIGPPPWGTYHPSGREIRAVQALQKLFLSLYGIELRKKHI
jgi:hypothetical protein